MFLAFSAICVSVSIHEKAIIFTSLEQSVSLLTVGHACVAKLMCVSMINILLVGIICK